MVLYTPLLSSNILFQRTTTEVLCGYHDIHEFRLESFKLVEGKREG